MAKVNINVNAPGAKEAQRDIDQTAREVKEFGDVTAAAGKKGGDGFKKVGQESGKAKKGIGGIATAAVAMKDKVILAMGAVVTAVMAVIAVYKLWYDQIKKIADAQKELVESSKGLDQAAKSLAGQAGVQGTQEGMSGARKQIRQIQKGGKLDSYEMADAVAKSTHSAFGTTGQLLTEKQMGVAVSLADFANRKDIDAGGIDDLTKVMAKVAESTGQEVDAAFAQEFMQKLSTVQQASKVKDFKQFMPGAIKAMMSTMAYGGSAGMALGQYASALDVEPTADLAASQVEKVNAMMLNPKVAGAIGGGFADMPYDQKITAFSGWASPLVGDDAGRNKLMKAGITTDQIGVLAKIYEPKQLPRVEYFRGLSGQGTGAQFRAESEGYGDTIQGQVEAYEASELDRKSSATQADRIGKAVMGDAEAEWTNINARGENDPFWRDKYEKGRKTLSGPFRERVGRLKEAGVDVGDLYDEIMDIDAGGGWDNILPMDVGEVELRLRELESKSQGRPIVNVTHIHHQTINNMPPGHIPGRVSPTEPRVGW